MSGTSLKVKLPVSYRVFSWQELVQREWGPEWGVLETVYEFSNGRTTQSTDSTTNGFYTKT